MISAEDGPAPLVLKACTMNEYLVDLRKPSIVCSKFRCEEEAPLLLPAKLLFSRSREEDADEKEDEVEPEMMIEDGTDTPAADKEGEDDDEEGLLSLAAGSVSATGPVEGCSGTCIVLYVKGSAEAWNRYPM